MQDATKGDERPVFDAADGDWFLQKLVTIFNSVPGAGMGITLNVGGMLISGQLASGKEYFEGIGAVIAGAENAQNDTGAAIANLFKSAVVVYERQAPDDQAREPPNYIHLKDAKFISPGQIGTPSVGVWWRGRLCEVA